MARQRDKIRKVVQVKKGKRILPNVFVLTRIYYPLEKDVDEIRNSLHIDNNDWPENAQQLLGKKIGVFLDTLSSTLKSIEENKIDYEAYGTAGHVTFLFNDDTKKGDLDVAYKEYKERLDKKLYDYFNVDYKETSKIDVEEPGGKGSSYSTFLVRELFLELADDNDIAISVDQDDELKKGAIINIANSMYEGGIVVSPFRMKDSGNLDITDDGGRLHNRAARKLAKVSKARRIIKGKYPIPELKRQKLFWPHGKNELIELLSNVILKNIVNAWSRFKARFRNFRVGRRCITELSSIGWTKSYTKAALYQFHQDLKLFLFERICVDKKDDETTYIMDAYNKNDDIDVNSGVRLFFTDHKAYEDFIDYYTLLYDGIPVSGNKEASHNYIKHPSSITSTPTVEDFQDHRTASLIALIDLCYAKKNGTLSLNECGEAKHLIGGPKFGKPGKYTELCENFEIKLLQFIASKTYQIESIIDKYIHEYLKEGKTQYADFSALSHKGFFTSKLSRLALGEDRGLSQDSQLFRFRTSRSAESSSNYSHLFSKETFNRVPQYKIKLKDSSPRYVLRCATQFEGELRGDHSRKPVDEDRVAILMKGNRTPHQRQLRKLIRCEWGLGAVMVGFIIAIAVLSPKIGVRLDLPKPYGLQAIKSFQTFIAAILALFGVILTILFNEVSKVKVFAEDEESAAKLYYSEFQDFIRHLEANLKVMIQIRKELASDSIVQDIHFDNLRWPENSVLFSDDMAKLISRDRVDDFARLKVNIRNINNSATWLEEQALAKKTLDEPLEWEMTRYFGYLVNMYYLESHDFRFPNANELDNYIHENSIKNRLSVLFMDYNSAERINEVNNYIDRYNDDRRMKRSVLVKKQ